MRKELADIVMNKLAACKCKKKAELSVNATCGKKAACKNAQQIKPVQLNAACAQNKCATQKMAEQFATHGVPAVKKASYTPVNLMAHMAGTGLLHKSAAVDFIKRYI